MEVISKEEHWIQKYWRPAMAMQYLIVCLFDFMLAPIGLTFYCAYAKVAYIAWVPLTLQESAFYHLSMAAILGVAAWTRGQAQIETIKNTTIINEPPKSE